MLSVGLAALMVSTPRLAAAQDASAVDPVVKAYNLQKDRAAAKKGAVDAQADLALATSAKMPKGPYDGTVTLGEKAGSAEAHLIAARAISQAATMVAVAAPPTCARIVLVAGTDSLTMAHWRVYETRRRIIRAAFDAGAARFEAAQKAEADERKAEEAAAKSAPAKPARKAGKKAPAAAAAMAASAPFVAAPIAVAATLDVITKLGSFFETNYEMHGVDIDADDPLLREAVTGALVAKGLRATQPLRLARGDAQDRITADVVDLHRVATIAAGQRNVADAEAKRLRALADDAAKAKKAAMADALNGIAAQYELASAIAKAALEDHAAFLTYMSGSDAAGVPVLQPVVVELALEADLYGPQPIADGGVRSPPVGACALALKVNNMGGGIYTKKNLWTFLGAMPFWAGGVATVTYTYIDPAKGDVVAAGAIERHGGYDRLNAITKSFSGS